jgi:hypothetical protein
MLASLHPNAVGYDSDEADDDVDQVDDAVGHRSGVPQFVLAPEVPEGHEGHEAAGWAGEMEMDEAERKEREYMRQEEKRERDEVACHLGNGDEGKKGWKEVV